MDPYPLSIAAAVVVGGASVYTWSRARSRSSRTRSTATALTAPMAQQAAPPDSEAVARRVREDSELCELVQVLPVIDFDASRAVALPLHGTLAEAVSTMSSMLGAPFPHCPPLCPGLGASSTSCISSRRSPRSSPMEHCSCKRPLAGDTVRAR
jgi:hypothetical protein